MVPRRIHTGVRLVAIAAIVAGFNALATTASPAAMAVQQHCVVNVVGQKATGEFVLSPMRCYGTLAAAHADGSTYAPDSSERMAAPAVQTDNVLLATHFDGFGLTGSSFSVFGASCNGWINMSPVWNNRISSTNSMCGVWHFDGFNLAGAVEFVVAPGGDLGSLNNRTSSTQYT
jgi:hypothetical protein